VLSFSMITNLSGVLSFSKSVYTIHTFKHLKHHGYHFVPGEIRAWATVHGWAESDAQQLGDYAEGVLAGTRYHTDPDPFGMWAIESWRADAPRDRAR